MPGAHGPSSNLATQDELGDTAEHLASPARSNTCKDDLISATMGSRAHLTSHLVSLLSMPSSQQPSWSQQQPTSPGPSGRSLLGDNAALRGSLRLEHSAGTDSSAVSRACNLELRAVLHIFNPLRRPSATANNPADCAERDFSFYSLLQPARYAAAFNSSSARCSTPRSFQFSG
jgi:hypothetical protein